MIETIIRLMSNYDNGMTALTVGCLVFGVSTYAITFRRPTRLVLVLGIANFSVALLLYLFTIFYFVSHAFPL